MRAPGTFMASAPILVSQRLRARVGTAAADRQGLDAGVAGTVPVVQQCLAADRIRAARGRHQLAVPHAKIVGHAALEQAKLAGDQQHDGSDDERERENGEEFHLEEGGT